MCTRRRRLRRRRKNQPPFGARVHRAREGGLNSALLLRCLRCLRARAFCPVLLPFCARRLDWMLFYPKEKGIWMRARARSLKGKSARNKTTTTTRRERERQSARNIIDPPKRNDGRDGSAKVSANVDMSKSPPRQGFGFCDDAFFVGREKEGIVY